LEAIENLIQVGSDPMICSQAHHNNPPVKLHFIVGL